MISCPENKLLYCNTFRNYFEPRITHKSTRVNIYLIVVSKGGGGVVKTRVLVVISTAVVCRDATLDYVNHHNNRFIE